MRMVIALGGNALLKRGEPPEAGIQQGNIHCAAGAIAGIAARHEVILTHGNGPQVGLLALQASAYHETAPYPLDVLDAESQGMIGHLLELELRNRLPQHEIITLLTQIQVAPDDPAFRRHSKPIGPHYPESEALRLAREHRWEMAAADGSWRRMVASPQPHRILAIATIRRLLEAGVLVICAGGGGIPVAVDPDGTLRGIEAVIDKDLAAALLARELEAGVLLLLTDVDAVYLDWGKPQSRPLHGTYAPDALRRHAFAPGSMGPKVEAACRFAEHGGTAIIGHLEQAVELLQGKCGTRIVPKDSPLLLSWPDLFAEAE